MNLNNIERTNILQTENIRFFIGINKARNQFKGTDRLYGGLKRLHEKYPDKIDLLVAESLPYDEYYKMVLSSDILLDQLYSYSPAMNGLLAMAMGKILVGGGEPEMYGLLDEKENFPIVNVYPSDEDIFNKLESILLQKNELPEMAEKSRKFVEDHHDYIKVAKQYVDFWNSK